MAAPAGHYAGATKDPSPKYEKAAKALRTVQAATDMLLDDADLQYYVALDKENVDLAARNQTLEAHIESQDRRIGSLLRQRDDALEKLSSTDAELESTKKEKKGLIAERAVAQEALREKEKKVASKEAEFAKERAALTRVLDSSRDTLGKLNDFSIKLKPAANNAKEIKARLDKIFSAAKALAETHFGVELPRNIMLDNDLWSAVKGNATARLKKDIPLPLSNSTPAKQMRTAAFLGILTYEIRQHILQPTYLLGGKINFNGWLDQLETDDVNREAYVRSVFLRLSEWFPKDIDAVMANQINTVVKNVSACVPHLVPQEPKDSKAAKGDFESKLRDFCAQACEHWKYIQTLDGRIGFDSDPDEARPLFPTAPEPAASGSGSGSGSSNTKLPRPNGNTSSPNPGKKLKDKDTQAAEAAATLADPVVVWPTFFNRSTDDQETFVRGYVLTPSQVAAARGEEKAQQPTGPRREQRRQSRASRSMSVSGGGANGLETWKGAEGNGVGGYQNGSAAGSSGSGSSVASFLPQGSGGGRKGA